MTGGCNHPPTHLIMAKEEKWSHFIKCQKLCIFNKTRDKTLNCSAARHLELRGLQDRRLEDLSAMVCATHSFDGGICIFLDGENLILSCSLEKLDDDIHPRLGSHLHWSPESPAVWYWHLAMSPDTRDTCDMSWHSWHVTWHDTLKTLYVMTLLKHVTCHNSLDTCH